MTVLHDPHGLAAHCRAWKLDPGVAARLARAVLRHGRGLQDALARAPVEIPQGWIDGLGDPALSLRERADSEHDGSTRLVFER